ncbi:sensor domain-containing protein [Mycobacterium branderi]|uniref:sensor domain-containing protein n=1 Tax=Mycobacterium branderi TaxID=43348 RepID=UPI001E29D233|nr:sensor domain-containing protein [Mycobacterium branderi]
MAVSAIEQLQQPLSGGSRAAIAVWGSSGADWPIRGARPFAPARTAHGPLAGEQLGNSEQRQPGHLSSVGPAGGSAKLVPFGGHRQPYDQILSEQQKVAVVKLIGRVAAVTAAALVAVGCTRVVDGAVKPAPGLPPRPLTGETVKKILLDEAQLSKYFGQSFREDPNSPPRFGDSDELFAGFSSDDVSPHECVGVVVEAEESAYRSGPVKQVAVEQWWNATDYSQDPAVISVDESVVALRAPADADSLFAQFSQQWQRCDGTTVTEDDPEGKLFSTHQISEVRVANSVLSATMHTRVTTPLRHARAIGVRVNCLVEVDVTFFSDQPSSAGIDLARQMIDRVSDLS